MEKVGTGNRLLKKAQRTIDSPIEGEKGKKVPKKHKKGGREEGK